MGSPLPFTMYSVQRVNYISTVVYHALQPRPKSGNVRPLSGRVFMRRTSERGWVAKAYPEARGSSQTELEIDDDFSDVDSLDSFFDDDFDTEQQDEKLQNLLSCNTLGVESKVIGMCALGMLRGMLSECCCSTCPIYRTGITLLRHLVFWMEILVHRKDAHTMNQVVAGHGSTVEPPPW